jgi:hypothetical protein
MDHLIEDFVLDNQWFEDLKRRVDCHTDVAGDSLHKA